MFSSAFDFGYPWWLQWGHLVPLGLFTLLALIAWRLKWRTWLVVVFGAFALWGLAGYLIVNRVLDINGPLTLPTNAFLPDGAGRVLDMGAGSGRATIMVLQARPRATVVALDIYSGYWGIEDNSPERLMRNAAAAGVSDRVEVRVGDMRTLPFPNGSFDGAVSSFAIDHLSRDGVASALREAARVLKPGGQLLVINLNVDGWVRTALPTPPGHGYFGMDQDQQRWRRAIADAGFSQVDIGTRPGVTFYLARK